MIIFIIVPKPAGYKFNNTHTEKINIYIDDANNVITDSYKKCGVVEEKNLVLTKNRIRGSVPRTKRDF